CFICKTVRNQYIRLFTVKKWRKGRLTKRCTMVANGQAFECFDMRTAMEGSKNYCVCLHRAGASVLQKLRKSSHLCR
ncbi:MAG: hypothetical protein PHY85_10295, partial [Bacteroidales bacterium]|nr:hypothetical protein [Bacteroidales bacterium]